MTKKGQILYKNNLKQMYNKNTHIIQVSIIAFLKNNKQMILELPKVINKTS